MSRAGDFAGRSHGRAHGGAGARRIETGDQKGLLAFRRRQNLQRDIGHDGESAPGAGKQFAEIVAGDILDHPPAGLERLAPAADRAHAQKMVARRPRLDAPGTGEIAGDRAPDRPRAVILSEKPAEIGRLERKLLVLFRQLLLDLALKGVPARAESTSSSGS